MKTIKNISKILLLVIIVFSLFYLFFVIPNDNRLPKPQIEGEPFSHNESVSYDFIENLPKALINSSSLDLSNKMLENYPYIQASKFLHTNPLNMHLSLGWFPLKTVHINSIFAPANTTIEFFLKIPQKPILKFNYGLISSIEKNMLPPAKFIIDIVDEKNQVHNLFNKTAMPLKPFKWRYYDSFYKNFYKYFYPNLEDREGKWDYTEIDIGSFAGQNVKIKFITESVSNNTSSSLSFWGVPRIYSRTYIKHKPNIILIVVDSFRADALNKKITPNLWNLAENGVNFKNAFSNGNMTKLSVYSFLTSRYPFEIPEAAMHYELTSKDKENFYRRRIATLPSLIGRAGYNTCAIGSISLFSDGYGLSTDLGFDESINLEHSGYSPVHVTSAGIDWLKKHGSENFFLMLYYDGPHGPYRPPLKYLMKSLTRSGVQGGFRMALYRGEIIYHDDYIGYLMEYLKSSGLLENTVIAFTSDHGVAFRTVTYDWPTKYGAWKKKKVEFHSHGVSLTPEDICVPLLFYFPEDKKSKNIETHVHLLDLAPTLAEISGAEIDRGFKGQSLQPLINGNPFSETITLHQGWLNYGVYLRDKYLYIKNTAPREKFPEESLVQEELYDIENDSKCINNLAYGDSPILSRIRTIFEGFVPHYEKNTITFKTEASKMANLSIFVKGEIRDIKSTGKVKLSGYSYLQVNLAPDQNIDFSTIPHDAQYMIKADINGKALADKDYLCGRYALPLIKNGIVKTEDRDFLKGKPKQFKQTKNTVLLLGIESENKLTKENMEKSPQQLKSMLEDWGYIN